MKNVVRDKTISFAVTQDLYDLVRKKAKQFGMSPSTFSYQVFLDFFAQELGEKK